MFKTNKGRWQTQPTANKPPVSRATLASRINAHRKARLQIWTWNLLQICEKQKIKNTNFFRNFKGVPLVRATYKERAGLPRGQGTSPEVFLERTNGSEVMSVFLTLHS